MNEMISLLTTRRSVRKYTGEMPSKEAFSMLLEAARFAPTGMNSQDTMVAVVTNREIRDRISALNAGVMGGSNDPFYGAPAVLIVFADRTRRTYLEDGSLAMGNLLNAAHALGLSSCWIHRAKEVFETEEGRALARSWGIPDDYIGIGNMIVGYADGEEPAARPRKEDFAVFVD